ncbi:pleckstrin homology-like domain family B member 3 isoform X2 [Amia ocellicauda]|uniref:pleckstrin homology-like domain family B member 3 isoform X2 n=1 Tax=Amia ocellicauda TaxID=2972642 RepID=UPI00346388A8
MPQHSMNANNSESELGSPLGSQLTSPSQGSGRGETGMAETSECSSSSASSPSSGDDTDSEESSSTESSQTRVSVERHKAMERENREREILKDNKPNAKSLEVEPSQVVTLASKLQQRIKELDQQREELKLEMQMEVALLHGEMQTERELLARETQLLDSLQETLRQQEMKRHTERQKEKMRLESERLKVDDMRQRHTQLQKQMGTQPKSLREQLQQRLLEDKEALEAAVRAFEDMEFQFLEQESGLEEEREASNRQASQDISQQQHRVNSIKERLIRLQDQVSQTQKQTDRELHQLSQDKKDILQNLHMHLMKDQKELSDLGNLTGSTPCMLSLNPLTIHGPGQNSLQEMNITSSLQRGRSLHKNIKPSDRPVSVHGSLLATEEALPLAVCSLTVTAHDSSSPDFLRSVTTSSLNPVNGGLSCYGNGSITLCSSTVTSRASSPGRGIPNIAEMERRLREARAEKERLLKARETKRKAEEEAKQRELEMSQQFSPEPETSSLCSSVEASPPPFRSLISCETFDLRAHLEAMGHNVETCHPVSITDRKCKGFLTKMGGKIKTWKKRWFVFDGEKKRLAYFADKEEMKLKGVIYFQAIEEVYYDHLRCASKSPHPKLTFCVKTYDRLFFMVAPTAEAMRIWMDVIVTATDEHGRY